MSHNHSLSVPILFPCSFTLAAHSRYLPSVCYFACVLVLQEERAADLAREAKLKEYAEKAEQVFFPRFCFCRSLPCSIGETLSWYDSSRYLALAMSM